MLLVLLCVIIICLEYFCLGMILRRFLQLNRIMLYVSEITHLTEKVRHAHKN